MKKVIALVTVMVGVSGSIWAQASVFRASAVPEIDPALGVGALGLLSAALLMARGRRKKPDSDLSCR